MHVRVQHTRINNGGRELAEHSILRPDRPMARRRILTKQSCFAWHFLAPNAKAPKLAGTKQIYSAEHAESLCRTDLLQKLKYENQWPHSYELSGALRMVGEIGVHHPKRWILASTDYDGQHGLMQRGTEEHKVERKGIGMEMKKARKAKTVKRKEKTTG